MAILGVDVSNVGQGRVGWGAHPGVGFGIAKASQGAGFTDPQVRANLSGMRTHGIVPGAYHFLDGSPGAAQCDHFLTAVGDPTGVILGLDVEMRGSGAQVNSFLTRFAQRHPGRKILLYSNHGLWASVGAPADVARFPVVGWHAGYVNGAYTPARGGLAASWAATASRTRTTPFGGIRVFPLIQFTDHASVPGMRGGVDGDVWVGAVADLHTLAGLTPTPTPTPTPKRPIMEFVVATTDSTDGKIRRGAVIHVDGSGAGVHQSPESWKGWRSIRADAAPMPGDVIRQIYPKAGVEEVQPHTTKM